MPQVKRILWTVVISLGLAAAWGCSDTNKMSIFNPETGHPENWASQHGSYYLAKDVSCFECHGEVLKGGVSKVSCFSESFDGSTCHPAGPEAFIHPENWGDPIIHGPVAKSPPGPVFGLTYCQICHGNDFSGGVTLLACSKCHGLPAPHPYGRWTGGLYTHTNVDQSNAKICGLCHREPSASRPSGCFNNSLCHGQRNVHPSGWGDPALHGPPAKSRPGSSKGFEYCAGCHGRNFTGGSSNTSCFPCHGVSAPHPSSPWTGGRFTHTGTKVGNAGICGDCHRNRSASASVPSGCFNNTMCHPHPPVWGDPDLHGPRAKARPGYSQGFSYCQECHGRNFGGGNPGDSCLRAGCHDRRAPHSPSPWLNGRTHSVTHKGNAEACAVCHRRPSAPESVPSGCFNNTLCHGEK